MSTRDFVSNELANPTGGNQDQLTLLISSESVMLASWRRCRLIHACESCTNAPCYKALRESPAPGSSAAIDAHHFLGFGADQPSGAPPTQHSPRGRRQRPPRRGLFTGWGSKTAGTGGYPSGREELSSSASAERDGRGRRYDVQYFAVLCCTNSLTGGDGSRRREPTGAKHA